MLIRHIFRVSFVCAASLAMAACDSPSADDEPTQGGGGTDAGGSDAAGGSDGTGGAPTNPLGEKLTLTLEPFDVQPFTERQVCKVVNLPAGAEIDVVRMASQMLGTSHHFNVYKALTDVTEPATEAESVVHDCSPASAQLDGSAAYIFGAATPERTVDMPAGVSFHLQEGHRIILEQHVINAGSEVIQGGVTFDLVQAGEEAVIEHHADIAWMANWNIVLQPAQETEITEHCTIPYDAEVFGLMSHTHSLGTHFSIEKWSGGDTEHLYDSEDWAHPIYMQFGSPLSIASGEGFQWTCTYQNTTKDPVTAGQDSTDEMCMMFAYTYPKNSLSADPVQCNKPF